MNYARFKGFQQPANEQIILLLLRLDDSWLLVQILPWNVAKAGSCFFRPFVDLIVTAS